MLPLEGVSWLLGLVELWYPDLLLHSNLLISLELVPVTVGKAAHSRRSATSSRCFWHTLAFFWLEFNVTKEGARLSTDRAQIHRVAKWWHFHQRELLLSFSYGFHPGLKSRTRIILSYNIEQKVSMFECHGWGSIPWLILILRCWEPEQLMPPHTRSDKPSLSYLVPSARVFGCDRWRTVVL